MGTGAGSAAYCIIEQGRVDQILQANAASRRLIFEEAAGISRFKARKVEALRKLERVDQNLLRLADIVDEVESRLNSLRSHASKAAKFREISTELKKLWWGLAGDDFRFRSETLANSKPKSPNAPPGWKRSTPSTKTWKSNWAGWMSKSRRSRRNFAPWSGPRRPGGKPWPRRNPRFASKPPGSRNFDGELARLRKQRTVMSARATEVVLEMEHVRGQVEHFAKEYEDRQAQVKKHIEEIKSLAKRIEQERSLVDDKREELMEQMREASAFGTQVSGLKKQRQISAEAKSQVIARRETLNVAIAACRSECEERLLRMEDSGEQVVHMGDHIQSIHNRRRQVLEERHEHLQALSNLREKTKCLESPKKRVGGSRTPAAGLGRGR